MIDTKLAVIVPAVVLSKYNQAMRRESVDFKVRYVTSAFWLPLIISSMVYVFRRYYWKWPKKFNEIAKRVIYENLFDIKIPREAQ